ncbi:hypothetical protein XELAEV_18017230mg [Xenopus laevis]|uniref:Uncharacterized protein n=1 Tax=Xenopus laevis TaxID=8355 RepID=A0A974DCQ6_XENLA|nr:hypothetical protein XELAEV_18017230mg [Xenopus laevis]
MACSNKSITNFIILMQRAGCIHRSSERCTSILLVCTVFVLVLLWHSKLFYSWYSYTGWCILWPYKGRFSSYLWIYVGQFGS